MAKISYWEKLRDPRWQRKRLEVMSLHDFTCQECGSTDSTLNVHHKLYRKGADPWDYATTELELLCEECHKDHHGLRQQVDTALARLNQGNLLKVLGYAQALLYTEPCEVDGSDDGPLDTSEVCVCMGIGEAVGLSVFEARAYLHRQEVTPNVIYALWYEAFQKARERLKAEPELRAKYEASLREAD